MTGYRTVKQHPKPETSQRPHSHHLFFLFLSPHPLQLRPSSSCVFSPSSLSFLVSPPSSFCSPRVRVHLNPPPFPTHNSYPSPRSTPRCHQPHEESSAIIRPIPSLGSLLSPGLMAGDATIPHSRLQPAAAASPNHHHTAPSSSTPFKLDEGYSDELKSHLDNSSQNLSADDGMTLPDWLLAQSEADRAGEFSPCCSRRSFAAAPMIVGRPR